MVDALALVADTIRALSVDAVEQARSGHPGMPLGCAEIGAVLFGEGLRHDPTWPAWPDRDRFVLSAGHGSMLLYSLLHLAGYALGLEEIRRFRQLGSATPGHPERGSTPGVEMTTGPLGQGFGAAVGMALAEQMLAARYNRPGFPVVRHRTWVLASDGDLMEGVTAETASLAGHLRLGRLTVIYDDNRVSIEGPTELAWSEDVGARFAAYGWRVLRVDGHDLEALRRALAWARQDDPRPALVIARTHLAAKSPMQGRHEAHGAPLGPEAARAVKRALGFPEDRPFFVPEEAYRYFQERRAQWQDESGRWRQMFEQWSRAYPDLRRQWEEAHLGSLPGDLDELVDGPVPCEPMATRLAGSEVLQHLARRVPYLVGGSADLAPSTRTYLEGMGSVGPGRYDGRNLHFGVREHAMGAILNGLALHGGLRPFGSTFLVFSDYMRPAMRLAAMMELPVIYVLTHDSVYVGEDGPTHQPVEHLEALRAIPGLEVWRPADAAEARLAWAEALRRRRGPTALVLTRQSVAPLRREAEALGDWAARAARLGAYIVEGAAEPVDLTLVASGSEAALAQAAARKLAEQGARVRVVSVPCRERLAAADPQAVERLLGEGSARVVVEAGVPGAWGWLVGPPRAFVGVERFGVSAPATEAARAVGLTVERVVDVACRLLEAGRRPAAHPSRPTRAG